MGTDFHGLMKTDVCVLINSVYNPLENVHNPVENVYDPVENSFYIYFVYISMYNLSLIFNHEIYYPTNNNDCTYGLYSINTVGLQSVPDNTYSIVINRKCMRSKTFIFWPMKQQEVMSIFNEQSYLAIIKEPHILNKLQQDKNLTWCCNNV